MCGVFIEIPVEVLYGIFPGIMQRSEEPVERSDSAFVSMEQKRIIRYGITNIITAAGITPMRWGFAIDGTKDVQPHARWESILQRDMFKNVVQRNRCLIPTLVYFEKKFKFWPANVEREKGIFFMAGVYRQLSGQPTPDFAVITREAADHVHHIHARMPVILSQSLAGDWLAPDAPIMEILSKANLDVRFEHDGPEQVSMFD